MAAARNCQNEWTFFHFVLLLLPLYSITSLTGQVKGCIPSAQACINARPSRGSICTVFFECCLPVVSERGDPTWELMGENARHVGAAAVQRWLYTRRRNLWNAVLQRVQKTSSTLQEAL